MTALLLALALQDIGGLVDQLSSDSVEERDAAAKALEEGGARLLPELRRRLTPALDQEAATRLRRVIRRIALPSLEPLRRFEVADGAGGPALWADGGKRLALIEGGKLVLHPAEGGDPVEGPAVREVAANPGGDRLALALPTGIRIVAASTLKTEAELVAETPSNVRFAGADQIFFVAGSGRLRRMRQVGGTWKADPLEAPRSVWHSDSLMLTSSPDGRWIALSAVLTDTATLLEVETRRTHGPIRFRNPGGDLFIPRARFSPDSRLLAVAGPGEVRVLQPDTLHDLVAIAGARRNALFDFSADSGYLVVADTSLRVFDVEENREVASRSLRLDRTTYVDSIACSTGGRVACVVKDYRDRDKAPDRALIFKLVFP